jgi:hypothetical protein
MMTNLCKSLDITMNTHDILRVLVLSLSDKETQSNICSHSPSWARVLCYNSKFSLQVRSQFQPNPIPYPNVQISPNTTLCKNSNDQIPTGILQNTHLP